MQVKLAISPSYSKMTSGQPVPILTLECRLPGSLATGVPIFKSPVQLEIEKDPWGKPIQKLKQARKEKTNKQKNNQPTKQSDATLYVKREQK